MRWIVTRDYVGTACVGLGENDRGIFVRELPDRGDSLEMEFHLTTHNNAVCYEGRCGDIDVDWQQGERILLFGYEHCRCGRLFYRRAGSQEEWRRFGP